jgi:choline dehydrogenase-like flavoprotein
MDHTMSAGAEGEYPGHEDSYYSGRRPNGIYIPRFRNVTENDDRYLRGFGYQGGASRPKWKRGQEMAGIGVDLKAKLRQPGQWRFRLSGFGEMLPDKRNHVWLDKSKSDEWGIPILNIDCRYRDNEDAMRSVMAEDAAEMMRSSGMKNVKTFKDEIAPGLAIHEMGTARMGHDPKSSVLNEFNQAHDVPNLFVTDGASMTSTACQNPSLTYMALTARASAAAVEMLQEGKI